MAESRSLLCRRLSGDPPHTHRLRTCPKTGETRRQAQKISLDEELAYDGRQSNSLLALHEALERLANHDLRLSRIVEMRFFGGMEEREIAEVLGVSERTVKRDWQFARAWLYTELIEQFRPVS